MTILFGFLFGTIGLGYFTYGKKNDSYLFMVSGVFLMGYPYFIDTTSVIIIIGILLSVVPFALKNYL